MFLSKNRLDRFAKLQAQIKTDPQYVLSRLANYKDKAYVPRFYKYIDYVSLVSKEFLIKVLWRDIGMAYKKNDVNSVISLADNIHHIQWATHGIKTKSPKIYLFQSEDSIFKTPQVPSQNLINRLLVYIATGGKRVRSLYGKKNN